MQSNQTISSLIRDLESTATPAALSIYSPLDYASPDALNANKIRLKNIINEIRHLSKTSDLFKVDDIDAHIKPLQELSDSRSELWQREAKSIAVFANKNFVKYRLLPIEQPEQQVIVSNNFLLEPLRKLVKNNKSFYVLSASHDKVELYYGDRFHLEPVELKSLPHESAEETMGIDEYPQSLQFHPSTTSSAKIGDRSSREQFHGQYNAVEVDRNIMKKYFRMVNDAVTNYMQQKKVPLVFAGVNYLFPLYEQVNSYKHLIKRPVEGNFQHGDGASLKELHSRALLLV